MNTNCLQSYLCWRSQCVLSFQKKPVELLGGEVEEAREEILAQTTMDGERGQNDEGRRM